MIVGDSWTGWEFPGGCNLLPQMKRDITNFDECALSPYCTTGDWVKVSPVPGMSYNISITHYTSEDFCNRDVNSRVQYAGIFDLEVTPTGACSTFQCGGSQSLPTAFKYAVTGSPFVQTPNSGVSPIGATPTSGTTPVGTNTPTSGNT
eukprot:CAMPEP_0168530028 /NCGR_PEP_ID=MMETSP0405-20121227/14353_1 /TAXON_ID=498012 /ORGANISM="Trichosphaerium sp, Strain Am-I-7 wt" /LENGTH=147 /DNA_ID=CAMNT_0008554051 /DNA_START=401 /DNA_END=840 /DNA_ORIENTATION=+